MCLVRAIDDLLEYVDSYPRQLVGQPPDADMESCPRFAELDRVVFRESVARGLNAYLPCKSGKVLGKTNVPVDDNAHEGIYPATARLQSWRHEMLALRELALAKERKDTNSKSPPTKRKRGRPPDTNPIADQRLCDAWDTNQYATYADLARELKISEENVSRAIDR